MLMKLRSLKIMYVNCGVKNYMKVDHRSYRRNFCSCENNNNNNNNKKKTKKKKKKSTLAVGFLSGGPSFRYNSLHNEIDSLQRSKVVSPHHEVELMQKKKKTVVSLHTKVNYLYNKTSSLEFPLLIF